MKGAPMLPSRPIPIASTRRRGFSLVLSLTVMSMLLLLCIGAAAMLAIELRVSRVSASYARARLNAIAGARIALGEVQRLAGPDQRVTATADILSSATDEALFDSGNGAASGTNYRPRLVGVWNSGATLNDNGDKGHFLKRDETDGFLTDRRFTGGRDWKADRFQSKRMLGWLVSGNEALPTDDANYVRPNTPPNENDVVLLGASSLGKNFSGKDASDGFGVRARRVTLPDGDSVNRYAYWVEDEGVKARLNLDGRYAGKVASTATPADGGYFNLMMPQRNNFDGVKASRPKLIETATIPDKAYTAANAEQVRNVRGFADLDNPAGVKLTDNAATLRAAFRHDIGFVSAGVLSDPVRGGLKRDLTGYLEASSTGDIATTQGLPGILGTGSMLADPFLAEPTLADPTRVNADKTRADLAPKWNLLRSWFGSPGTTSTTPKFAEAKVDVRAPNTFAPGGGIIPYTLPDYKKYEVAPLAPVMTQASAHIAYYYDATLDQTQKLGVLVMPKVVLWNPYSVPLNVGGMRVRFASRWDALARITVDDATTPGTTRQTAYQWTATTGSQPLGVQNKNFGQRLSMSLPAGEIIPPGAAVVYTAPQGFKKLTIDGGLASFNGNVLARGTGGGGAFLDESWSRTAPSLANPAIPVTNPFFAALTQNHATAKVEIQVVAPGVTAGFAPLSSVGKDGDAHIEIFLEDSQGKTVQEVDMNHYMTPQMGYSFSAWDKTQVTPMFPNPGTLPTGHADAFDSQAQINFLFRLPFFDDTTELSGLYRPNKDINGFVQYNLRATRHTRFPFDLGDPAKIQRFQTEYVSGLFTTELDASTFADSKYANTGGFTSPFFSAAKATFASPRFALFDLPRKETGILSVGALQSAPLTQLAFAPALAVGNGFLHPGIEPHRTGWTLSDETAKWTAATPGWPELPAIVKQRTGTGVPADSSVDANTHFLVDWAFELNEALWDTWFSSGIPAANAGWSSDTWENSSTTAQERAFRNARLSPASAKIAAESKLYRASQSLLLDGAFNVNSTSVAAWTALLRATRNLPVPLENAADSPEGVAFLRSLRPPVKGTTAPGTFKPETWGGFRRLSDSDITTLAERIVAEVRARGPFLGLSDFVNRRLKTGPVAADDTVYDYLGTLQAAIERAKLNAAFDNDGTDGSLNRAEAAGTNNGFPAHRVAHRAAGAPGYLLQSDILQHIGPVLSSRSDTFTIRALGESDGATAVVEFVVQRTPAPLVAAEGKPFTPKTPTSPADGYRDAQLFGRRFTVLATRWISPDEI